MVSTLAGGSADGNGKKVASKGKGKGNETTLHLIPQPPPKSHKIPLPMQSTAPRPPSAPKARPKSSLGHDHGSMGGNSKNVYDRSKGRRIVEKVEKSGKQRPVSAFSIGLATGTFKITKDSERLIV